MDEGSAGFLCRQNTQQMDRKTFDNVNKTTLLCISSGEVGQNIDDVPHRNIF